MHDPAQQAADTLQRVRKRTPLVHNITNFVAMNYIANALLAAGASPVMAHAAEEAAEMAGLADALALNIGTLTPEWITAMILAGRAAADRNHPVVLDPVGAGATSFRTGSARKILRQVPVRIIRGNPSEVLSLRGGESKTKGVDTIHSVDEAA
ncbi:MAG: hydroxyethylthiazole kinase, partial [Thermodesulfobacteriota bacterium]